MQSLPHTLYGRNMVHMYSCYNIICCLCDHTTLQGINKIMFAVLSPLYAEAVKRQPIGDQYEMANIL